MDQNLFNSSYTEGDLTTVETARDVIGQLAVVVISFVGFAIVIFTILKNAMMGLYAVSPKIWDRVDEAKRATLAFKDKKFSVDAGEYQGSGNMISVVVGSLGTILLSFLPNVKAMTEADGQQLDVKAYFLKSIPMACIQIFVGVFIFFGYPTKISDKFSQFGRGVLDLWLDNTDPMAYVKALPSKFYLLQLSTDGSSLPLDKNANSATKKAYSAYVGYLDDMTAESRSSISLQIESWVLNQLNGIDAKYCDTEQYKSSYEARVSIGEADLTRINNVTAKDGTYTVGWQVNINTWTHGSAKTGVDNSYLVLTATYTPVAQSTKTTSTTCVANVTSGQVSKGNSLKVTFDSSATTNYGIVGNGGGCTVQLSDGTKVSSTLSVVGNAVTITPNGSGDIKDAVSIISVGGLRYKYASSYNSITTINLDQGSFGFSSVKGDSSWKWGDDPSGGEASTVSGESGSDGSSSSSGGGLGSN